MAAAEAARMAEEQARMREVEVAAREAELRLSVSARGRDGEGWGDAGHACQNVNGPHEVGRHVESSHEANTPAAPDRSAN